MRFSTFVYCVKQGLINICRNVWFSLASTAIISACIFLFCLFFALMANVDYGAKQAQETVGITVFFDEGISQEAIQALGDEIRAWPEIKEMKFVSSDEAWSDFKQRYFEGMEELAEGFEEDNPLADSSSYEIFLNHIEDQPGIVERLEGLQGVRRVRYSATLVEGFNSMGKILGILSALIIGVLLAVAVFLISNTISVAAAFRRQENEIMRYIGASNHMIRAPFVVEGMLLGSAGSVIPLAGIYILYRRGILYLDQQFGMLAGLIEPLPLNVLFPYMMAASLLLGVGMGFIVSFFTIRRHLRV